jgi:outer membrane biosynthesis protein TonB
MFPTQAGGQSVHRVFVTLGHTIFALSALTIRRGIRVRFPAITVLLSLLLTVRAFALPEPGVPMSSLGSQQVSTTVGEATVRRDPNAPATASKPQPDASGKYHVGDSVTPPKLIHTGNPDFSKEPRYKKIAGITELALTVDEKGIPQDIHVVHSLADGVSKKQRAEAIALDSKAVETVKKYVFEPASFNGNPVPLEVRVPVSFQIH